MDIRRGLRLPISDLDCPAAAPVIERALASSDGVLRAYVNAATRTAYIDYDAAETDPWLLAQTIDKAGYKSGPPIEP